MHDECRCDVDSCHKGLWQLSIIQSWTATRPHSIPSPGFRRSIFKAVITDTSNSSEFTCDDTACEPHWLAPLPLRLDSVYLEVLVSTEPAYDWLPPARFATICHSPTGAHSLREFHLFTSFAQCAIALGVALPCNKNITQLGFFTESFCVWTDSGVATPLSSAMLWNLPVIWSKNCLLEVQLDQKSLRRGATPTLITSTTADPKY